MRRWLWKCWQVWNITNSRDEYAAINNNEEIPEKEKHLTRTQRYKTIKRKPVYPGTEWLGLDEVCIDVLAHAAVKRHFDALQTFKGAMEKWKELDEGSKQTISMPKPPGYCMAFYKYRSMTWGV